MNDKYDSSYIFTLIVAVVMFLVLAFVCALGTNTVIDAICEC